MRLKRQNRKMGPPTEAEHRANQLKTATEQTLFPIHVYLVGVNDNGEEVFRHNLECQFTAFGQTIHISDLGPLELEQY